MDQTTEASVSKKHLLGLIPVLGLVAAIIIGMAFVLFYANAQQDNCSQINTGSFYGCYYGNKNLGNLRYTRTDSYPLNFDWGLGSPGSPLGTDNFSVKWRGNFPFETANYEFSITVDDGARLYIDGQLVIDRWFDQAATTYKAVRSMTSGNHIIELEYFETKGRAVAKMSWVKVGTSTDTTPPVISGVGASSITPWAASINWNTNEPSDGQVEFCTTQTKCGMNAPAVSALSTSHTINLSNLTAGTTYFYWVRSKDVAGNQSEFGPSSFVTDVTPPTPLPSTPTPTPTPNQFPFPGPNAHNIPGLIEAENFDNGAEGAAYHDTAAGNSGGKYRTTDVDIESSTEHGYNIG
ncbi:MAG: PA14 domain-containing protein, partial [bacterium]|nr:PA14 domain-containing protein [bacterium]